MFDVVRLSDYAFKAIQEFAKSHQNETFYAFVIDDRLLCLNSESARYETWLSYINTGSARLQTFYKSDEGRELLRFNTGDWKYQGFAEFNAENGWDAMLHAEHCREKSKNQTYTAYAIAMNAVFDALKSKQTFDCLNRTNDFSTILAEHE